ncbi:MAG: cell division protein FtsA [Chloroflexi bacterium]|nr:cell division protein FtsA [Chloroflexota bacterium]
MARIFASIDVGTSKITTIVANIGEEETIQILGSATVPAHGVHKGLVVDIDLATEAVRDSVMMTERTSGLKIESAYVGVTGRHINAINSRGVVATTRNDKRVTGDDLERVLESARSITLPGDRRLLHVLPRHYTLDGTVKVQEPVGMHGFRLDVETHIVTAAAASTQNLIKAVRGAGVDVEDLVFSPLAIGEAVLSEHEMNSGVIVADIGAGTTDVAIFKDGCVWHSATFPVGGYQATRDIAIGLGISNDMSEQMKLKYGSVMTTNGVEPEYSELDVGNRHTVSYRELNDIIRARLEETLRLIMLEIPRDKQESLVPAGLVLTGGTSTIPGMEIMAREALEMDHVRLGYPGGISGISDALHDPSAATSVGLLYWGANNCEGEDKWKMDELRPGITGMVKTGTSYARKLWEKRKQW